MAFSSLACTEILNRIYKNHPIRSVVLKLLLVAMAVTTAFMTYGSVRGVEAGISLLVVLASSKFLEAHSAREFRVMVLIGWMLCLCGFFLFTQSRPRFVS